MVHTASAVCSCHVPHLPLNQLTFRLHQITRAAFHACVVCTHCVLPGRLSTLSSWENPPHHVRFSSLLPLCGEESGQGLRGLRRICQCSGCSAWVSLLSLLWHLEGRHHPYHSHFTVGKGGAGMFRILLRVTKLAAGSWDVKAPVSL